MDDGLDSPFAQDPNPIAPFVDGSHPMFTVVLAVIVMGFLFVIGRLVLLGTRYATATPQTAEATCIGKRTHVSGGSGDSSAHTRYYATFELADGSRKELAVSPGKIGLLAEGDRGTLTWRDVYFQDLARR